MSGLYSVEELKKIVTFSARVGNVGGKVAEDKKVNWADLQYMPEFFLTFPILIDVKWGLVVPEGKDLQAEEGQELVAHFCQEFDIPQDNAEVTVESVLTVVTDVVGLIFKLINIFKKKPAEPAPVVEAAPVVEEIPVAEVELPCPVCEEPVATC